MREKVMEWDIFEETCRYKDGCNCTEEDNMSECCDMSECPIWSDLKTITPEQ